MNYQKRGSAPSNPNRVTINFDPITGEALAHAAKSQKLTRERLAYELIQRGLGITTSAPAMSEPPQPDAYDAERERRIQQSLGNLDHRPTQGRA